MDLSDIDREGLLSPNCCTGSLLTALITLFSCAHCTTLHQPSLFPSPVYLFQHWCQYNPIWGLSQPGHKNKHVPMSIDKCECQCQYECKCGSMSVRGEKKRQKASPSRLLPLRWKKPTPSGFLYTSSQPSSPPQITGCWPRANPEGRQNTEYQTQIMVLGTLLLLVKEWYAVLEHFGPDGVALSWTFPVTKLWFWADHFFRLCTLQRERENLSSKLLWCCSVTDNDHMEWGSG